ncbi:MAG: hypothetical protein HYZ95_03575 [Candidatus Omnitrophica bacterium]|nr:hypothetical protein [Candidatus Omnitrophota bacterium]
MGSSTGIYIGTENIDIVSLGGSFQRPRLLSFARAKLPNQTAWRSQVRVEGQPSAEPAAPATTEEPMIACIQTLLAKLGLAAPQVQAGLPGESSVIRYFQMPAIPPHERKMAISFEAKKYLPFKLEELITDFQILTRHADPTIMRIMFFGIKRSSSFMYAELFRSCGVSALCLEPAPISLLRLLRSSGQLGREEVAVVLLLEQDTATINITRSDLLYLSRNVTIAAQAASPEGPSDALLDALVNESRVSMDYYRRRFLGEPAVTRVLVFGQPLEQSRLDEFSKALDLPVQPGDPFGRVAAAQSVPIGLAVATGLALRGLDRARGVNLLAPQHRPQGQGLLKPLLIEAAACSALLALWYGLSVADLQSWKQKLSQLQTQQVQPAQVPSGAPVTELRELLGAREKDLQVLQSFAAATARPSALLAGLSRLLPEEAWLRYAFLRDAGKEEAKGTVSTERRRVLRLVGNAFANDRDRELERINQFLATLRQDSLFSSAFSEFSLDSVQRNLFGEEEVTEFQLTCASHPEELLLEEQRGRAGGRRYRR